MFRKWHKQAKQRWPGAKWQHNVSCKSRQLRFRNSSSRSFLCADNLLLDCASSFCLEQDRELSSSLVHFRHIPMNHGENKAYWNSCFLLRRAKRRKAQNGKNESHMMRRRGKSVSFQASNHMHDDKGDPWFLNRCDQKNCTYKKADDVILSLLKNKNHNTSLGYLQDPHLTTQRNRKSIHRWQEEKEEFGQQHTFKKSRGLIVDVTA